MITCKMLDATNIYEFAAKSHDVNRVVVFDGVLLFTKTTKKYRNDYEIPERPR